MANGKTLGKEIQAKIRAFGEGVLLPKLETMDQILGLRSWGLVLYGALPASLSLLGLVEIKVQAVNLTSMSTIITILLISSLPLLVTFLLVRSRERDWYFTVDYLNVRSLSTTLLIVLCATIVSGGAGIIRGRYVLNWNTLLHPELTPAIESFLFGMASLVLSSTLFATILTKDANLPGLPSSGFVTSLANIRRKLIAIRLNPIWREYSDSKSGKTFEALKKATDELLQELQGALSHPGNAWAKRRLRPLESQVTCFAQIVVTIKNGGDEQQFRWQARFADLGKFDGKQLEDLTAERDSLKEDYAVLQQLSKLRLGG